MFRGAVDVKNRPISTELECIIVIFIHHIAGRSPFLLISRAGPSLIKLMIVVPINTHYGAVISRFKHSVDCLPVSFCFRVIQRVLHVLFRSFEIIDQHVRYRPRVVRLGIEFLLECRVSP